MWIRSHILQPAVGVLTVQNTQYPKRLVGPENGPPVFDTCSRAQETSHSQLTVSGYSRASFTPLLFALAPQTSSLGAMRQLGGGASVGENDAWEPLR